MESWLDGSRMDHVGLSVEDVDALGRWYRDAFGLREEARFAYPFGRRQVTGVLLTSPQGWRLELQHCEGSSAGQPADVRAALLRQGLGHLCLRVDDLDGAFAELVQRGAGVTFPPTPSPVPGMSVSYLTDPEGNFIELLQQTVEPV